MANLKMNGRELGTIVDVLALPVAPNINNHALYRLDNNIYAYDAINEKWSMLCAVDLMIGATQTEDGESGAVPAPEKTDGGAPKVLLSDATWGDVNYYGGYLAYITRESDPNRRLQEPLREMFLYRKIDPSKTTVMSTMFNCQDLFGLIDDFACVVYMIISPRGAFDSAEYDTDTYGDETESNVNIDLMIYFYGMNNETFYGCGSYTGEYNDENGIEDEWLFYLTDSVLKNSHKVGADSSYEDRDGTVGFLGGKAYRHYDFNKNGFLKNTQYLSDFNIKGTIYPMALVTTTLTVGYESLCPRAMIIQDAVVGEYDESATTSHKSRKFRRYGFCYMDGPKSFLEYLNEAMWGQWKDVEVTADSIVMITLNRYNELASSGSLEPRVIYIIEDE